jgi:cytochrome c553
MRRSFKSSVFRLSLAAAALLAVAGCQTKETVGNDHSVLGTEHVCSSCHGLEGRSDNPTFPILAAQQKDYLEAQLHAFRDKTRADPHARTYMFGMAAKLDDATIAGLATFYSSQHAAYGVGGDPQLIAAGQKIFAEGIASENVPPCVACHGEHAEGNGAVPRLADQHATYLIGQLQAFRINSRANEMMHANALGLTDDQIRAVATYLASL